MSVILLIGILSSSPDGWSQRSAAEHGSTEYGIWGAYAPGVTHFIGTASDRQLGELGFRWGKRLKSWQNVEFEWTIDVIPVEIAVQPAVSSFVRSDTASRFTFVETGRQAVYGGGVNPIGLKFTFFTSHRLQLFGGLTGGFVASTGPVPENILGATQFNFTFDFVQAGIELFDSSRSHAWVVGYKVQHISNAYRSDVNPGVDFNVIFLGYSFFR
jgi:hypothetical protein